MENKERNEIILQLACELLENLGIVTKEAFVEDMGEDQGQVLVSINVENPGLVIGFKGKTIAALQTVLSLMAKNKLGVPVHLIVDVNGYRETQKNKLEKDIEAAIARVEELGQPYHFPPMTPFDRRIVHTMANATGKVISESEGEGESRHVVLKPLV